MTDWRQGAAGLLCLAGALASAAPALAQAEAAPARMVIGYVELDGDLRYDDQYTHAQLPMRALGRPFVGAEVALGEAAQIGSVIGVEFAVERRSGATVDDLAGALEAMVADGVGFVIADLPAAELLQLSDRFAGRDVVIFNATAPDDILRGADCRANIIHVMPAYAMLADALVQFLVSKNWRELMVLQGSLDGDAQFVAAIERAAQRFGATVREVRPFVLSNDPRQRDQNNVALVTGGTRYDVVVVADTDGAFGRYVPYQVLDPRPVAGTAGLVPEAWHWAWERNGAPQLNGRFERVANRRMAGVDWGVWASVKAVVQSVLRAGSTEFGPVRDYMLGERLNLDGFKGNPMSVRSWDQQVRQPILLAGGNAVIARAPLEGFLHQTNDLDTLGYDAPETECRLE
jgi:ABC transporter substrate binding protein (PQQ-dependent alcohol dehydrogenase system)